MSVLLLCLLLNAALLIVFLFFALKVKFAYTRYLDELDRRFRHLNDQQKAEAEEIKRLSREIRQEMIKLKDELGGGLAQLKTDRLLEFLASEAELQYIQELLPDEVKKEFGEIIAGARLKNLQKKKR